jgi:signal transduction histidine kinase
MTLGPGEGGGIYLAVKPGIRLAAAVPSDTPFRGPRLLGLARRTSRVGPGTPVVARAPVSKAWPSALAVALPQQRGALIILAPDAVSARTRRRVSMLASLVSAIVRHRVEGGSEPGVSDRTLLRQILGLARSDPGLERRGGVVVDVAMAVTEADVAALWIQDEPGGAFGLLAARHPPGGARPHASLPAPLVDELRDAGAFSGPSSAALSRGREVLGAAKLASALLAPVDGDRDPLGVLAAGRLPGGDSFDAESGDRLGELAALVALPLARSALERDCERLAASLGAARRIARAVGDGRPLEQALPVVARELETLVSGDMSGILAVERGGDAVLLALDRSDGAPRRLRPLGDWKRSRIGDSLARREAVIVQGSHDTDAALLPFADLDSKLREALVVPLVVDAQPLGALVLGARTPGRFRPADIPLLRPAARVLGVALRDARARRVSGRPGGGSPMAPRAERRPAQYAALGRLAEVLAHEIRNPLTVIGTTLQYLRNRRLVDEEYIPLLESAVHKAREVDESLDSLLSLSRPIALRLEPAPIAPLLGEVAEFIRLRAADRAVDVTVKASSGLAARIDRRVLGQALLNLALNAIDAMRGGGQLAFGARRVTGSELVAITVSDTGSGIDSESLEVIFEPYFTTKLHGTGLGLAITRRIVEEHGGSIQVASEPGRGTVFTIMLLEHR